MHRNLSGRIQIVSRFHMVHRWVAGAPQSERLCNYITSEQNAHRFDKEQEQQAEAEGDVTQAGLSREPAYRREPTRRRSLDRLGLDSNAFGVDGRIVGGDGNAPSRAVLENTRCSRYNVQTGGGKGKVIFDTALYMLDTKPGRGISHCGVRGRTIGSKVDARRFRAHSRCRFLKN